MTTLLNALIIAALGAALIYVGVRLLKCIALLWFLWLIR